MNDYNDDGDNGDDDDDDDADENDDDIKIFVSPFSNRLSPVERR